MISKIVIKAVNKALEAIGEMGLEYAIFGGLALQAWKRIRSTLDVDIMVITKKFDAGALVATMSKKGLEPDKENPKVKLGEITLLRFKYTDEESFVDIKVDVAIAHGDFPEQVVGNRIKLNIFGKEMWFVKCEDLILLKLLSRRPIDIVDAQELFHLNKEILDIQYLRKNALELKINKKLQEIATKKQI